MSDISEVTEAPVETFDLDAELESAATTAPDEWRGKVSKIQSEVKGLRDRHKPFAERFDGMPDEQRESVLNFVGLVKDGNFDHAAEWLLNSAKNLTGERFSEFVDRLSPKQQEQLEKAVEDATEPDAPLTPQRVQELVQEALKAERAETAQQAQIAEQTRQIEKTLTDLGYEPRSLEARQVCLIARDETKGDLKAAHEQYEKFIAEKAKAYLQKKDGAGQLLDDSAETPKPEAKDSDKSLPPAERIARRIRDMQTAV